MGIANERAAAFITAGAAITTDVILGGAIAANAATPAKVASNLSDYTVTPKPASAARRARSRSPRRAPARSTNELATIRTPKDAAKLGLPNGEASEKGIVGELEDVAPGKTKGVITLTLKKGHYVLLCNLGSHYKAGMHINFTVK